jgi:4-hydroxybenzoate polyprenyltransferase
MQYKWWLAIVYSTLFVILPLSHFFFRHYRAKTKADFAALSNYTKWIMLTGIFSMVFFIFYF